MKWVDSRIRSAIAMGFVFVLCTQVQAADTLKPVFFDTGSFKLSKESEKRLDAVLAYHKAHPNELITLVGSTDPRGTVQVNFQLRRARVNAAKQYLVDHGFAEEKVQTRMADPPLDSIPVSEYSKLRKVSFDIGDHQVAEVEPKNAKPVKEPEEAKDEKGRPIVNVLYWKSVNHALYILAKEKGFFEDEGLHVNLRESQLEANDIARELNESDKVGRYILDTKELKNKKVFIGAVCAYGFHDALAKKLPLVEIGSMVANVNTMIMKKDLIAACKKDLRVFKGHTLARVKNQPTDIDPVYLFVDKLATAGIKNVDYTVKWYDTWDASWEAVAKGEVDAAISLPPVDVEFVEKHPDLGLLFVRELFPYMPCCRQVVTRENLRKNRDRYVHFMRAVIKAHKFFNEHPDESTKIVAKFLGTREAVVKQVLVSKGYALNPDPMFKGAQAFRKAMLSLGSKVGGDLRESIDTSLYEDALVSLQKENASDPYYAKMIEAYRRAN